MAGYSVCTLKILDVHSDINKKIDKKEDLSSNNSEELQEIIAAIHKINGYIIVYSRSDRSSFKSVAKFIEFIRKIKSNEDENTAILIVANKTDSLKTPSKKLHQKSKNRASKSSKSTKPQSESEASSESDDDDDLPITKSEGERLAQRHHCYFIESSAETGANVPLAFETITKLLVTRHLNLSFRKSLSFEIERSSATNQRSASKEWSRGKRKNVKTRNKRCIIS